MHFHAIDPLTTTAFGLVCFVAGGLVMFLLSVLLKQRPEANAGQVRSITPGLNDHLAMTAQHWAQRRGTPDLANWAHHRLRTFVTSAQRPPDPPTSSWRDRP